MNDGDLKASLERSERAYEDLVQTYASRATMLAEAIRSGSLSEFRQRMADLALLLRSADAKRTELGVELLARRLEEAEKEHRRAQGYLARAGDDLEEARKAYALATSGERTSALEVRRLQDLHREETARLERLRSPGSDEKEETAVSSSPEE